MTVYISFDGIDDIECELVDGQLIEIKIGSFFVDLLRMPESDYRFIAVTALREAQRIREEENDELKVERYLSEKSA